ncbi:hypothetical protein LIA77_11791 [Sarocladium implicatum]|nr:hypothetical protein LIA77_11791 [Sarocladium implicatum]
MGFNVAIFSALASIFGSTCAAPAMRGPVSSRDLKDPGPLPASLVSRSTYEPPKYCDSDDDCDAPLICGSGPTWDGPPYKICREYYAPIDDPTYVIDNED